MRILLFTVFALFPSIGFGAGTCGACGDDGSSLPPELEARGLLLEQSFFSTLEDDLARQAWAGTLCQNHPCNDEVTELQANDLLRDFIARGQRDSDRNLSWLGIGLSLLSAFAALFALRQTHQSNKMAKDADVRSLRSEARLDQIKET